MMTPVDARVRLLRHQAKSWGVHIGLTLAEAHAVVHEEDECTYCGTLFYPDRPGHLGLLYPLADGGPLVQANLAMYCPECRTRGNPFEADLAGDRLTAIHRRMAARAGWEQTKSVVRLAAGIL